MALNRQHPFFSPFGCLTALVLFGGVTAAVWFTGGMAFSPGPLTALAERGAPLGGFKSHAEFENDCQQCHTPARGVEAARCETCHTDVRDEQAAGAGLHGGLITVDTGRCQSCHADHKGRAFDPSDIALANFDHAATGFSLARHGKNYDGSPLECKVCHTDSGFAFNAASCADCHGARDAAFMVDHAAAFGGSCATCHDGVDSMSSFDHTQVAFVVDGAHANISCAACHKSGQAAKDTPTQCAACHAEPAAHAGMFGTDCAACHSAAAWTPATLDSADFDHAATGFALTTHTQDYDGSPFTCRACHTGDKFSFAAQTCVDCHGGRDTAFMPDHINTVGSDCLSCHDGTGSLTNFDHSQIFPLDGAHGTATCESCHANKQFKGTPKECAACHAEPQIHAGLFGADCVACHSTAAWTPAALKNHIFPLDHGESGEVACVTCHPAKYTEYTCYGCHEHTPARIESKHAEEGVRDARLNDCAECHPTGREEEGGD